MDFALTPEQESIVDAVGRICARFDEAYWLDRDRTGAFPADFHQAVADGGWLGIAMPESVGGGRARRHRGGTDDEPGGAVAWRHGGLLGHPHEYLRAAAHRGVRHGGTTETLAARPDRGPQQIVLCGHRAGRRARHDKHQDEGGPGGRPLCRRRPQDLDVDGAGRRQGAAAGAHDAAGGLRAADGWPDALLHGP